MLRGPLPGPNSKSGCHRQRPRIPQQDRALRCRLGSPGRSKGILLGLAGARDRANCGVRGRRAGQLAADGRVLAARPQGHGPGALCSREGASGVLYRRGRQLRDRAFLGRRPRGGESCARPADRLGAVSRVLGAFGHVDLVADFDIAHRGDSLRVERLDTSLSGASPVASVQALQSFEFNTSTGVLKVARPSGDLVGVSAKGMPLAWLRGALPRLGLTGSDAQGTGHAGGGGSAGAADPRAAHRLRRASAVGCRQARWRGSGTHRVCARRLLPRRAKHSSSLLPLQSQRRDHPPFV